MKVFFIPGNVPSSKNSRNAVTIKKKDGTEKTMVIASKTVQKYRANTAPYYSLNKGHFKKAIKDKSKPFYIGFFFIRGSRHKWDLINPEQTVQDEMVKHEWLEDDNVDFLCPVPVFINGEFWMYDKSHPGVLIVVFDDITQINTNFTPREIMEAMARKADIKFFRNAFNKNHQLSL